MRKFLVANVAVFVGAQSVVIADGAHPLELNANDHYEVGATTPAELYTVEGIKERFALGLDAVHLFVHRSHDNEIFIFHDNAMRGAQLDDKCPPTLCGDEGRTQEDYDIILDDDVEHLDYDIVLTHIKLKSTGRHAPLLEEILPHIPENKTLWLEPFGRGAEANSIAIALHTMLYEKRADYPEHQIAIYSPDKFVLKSVGVLEKRRKTEPPYDKIFSVMVHEYAGWTFEHGEWQPKGAMKGSLEGTIDEMLEFAKQGHIQRVFFEADHKTMEEAMRLQSKYHPVRVGGRYETFVKRGDTVNLAVDMRKHGCEGFVTHLPEEVEAWLRTGRPNPPEHSEEGGGWWWWLLILLLLLVAGGGAYYYNNSLKNTQAEGLQPGMEMATTS